MKIKKNRFSTMISDLYGENDYEKALKVNREYWYYFDENTEIFKASHKHWNKFRITYIRSGCLFYDFPEYPDVKERFCPIQCFMASRFVLAELDPIKDLKDLVKDIDSEAAKLKYSFDDEHTIIKNWPNEREIEVDEDELYNQFGGTNEYILIKILENKD